MAGWPQRNRQKDQGDDPALIELKKKDAAQKKQDEDEIAAGTLQIVGSKRFRPLPEGFYRAIYSRDGVVAKYYENTVDKIYEAMKAHKKYYDDTMAECGYPVKDIIPDKKIIREHIFTLDAFLFGWFAMEVMPDPSIRGKKWATENSFPLVQEFILDVMQKKTPRVLRGV